MKVKISIEQEFDLSDDNIFDDAAMETSIDTRVDYIVNRFCEDVEYAVIHGDIKDSVGVEYIDA